MATQKTKVITRQQDISKQMSTLALVAVLTVPLAFITGVFSGLLGLAYDVPRAEPNAFQSAMNTAAIACFFASLWGIPGIFAVSFIGSIVNMFTKKRWLSYALFGLVALAWLIACLAWVFGIASLPAEA